MGEPGGKVLLQPLRPYQCHSKCAFKARSISWNIKVWQITTSLAHMSLFCSQKPENWLLRLRRTKKGTSIRTDGMCKTQGKGAWVFSWLCCIREKERSGEDEREAALKLQRGTLRKPRTQTVLGQCWAVNANMGVQPFFPDSSYSGHTQRDGVHPTFGQTNVAAHYNLLIEYVCIYSFSFLK